MRCAQRCPNDHGGYQEDYQRAWARVLSACCGSGTCWQWIGHTVHEQQEVWGKYHPCRTRVQTHQWFHCWNVLNHSKFTNWGIQDVAQFFPLLLIFPLTLCFLSMQVDFRDYPPLLRQAVSIARKIQDPLMEYAQVCSTDEDILCLKLHPLQVRGWRNYGFLWFYLSICMYCCILLKHDFFDPLGSFKD